ncbi:Retrovirus polyprotein, partial [Aphelenchoides avenae]
MCSLEPPEPAAPPSYQPLKRPIIRVEVNGQKTRALFDSGSTITYCRKTVADRLKIANREPCDIIATAANETSIPFLSEATTSVRFGNNVSLNVRMRIAEDNLCPAPVLIGSDVMAQLNDLHMDIGLNWARQVIKIGNEALAMVNAVNFNLHSNPIATASETVILPPHTETFVWATLDRIVPEKPRIHHDARRQTIAHHGYDLRAPLRIRNDTNKHVRVYKGVTLAILEPLMACCTRGPIHVVHATATEPHVPDFHEHITSEDDDDALEPIDLDKAAEAPEAHWEDKLPRQPGAVDDKLKLDDCILSEQGKAELRRLIKYHHRAFVQNDGVIGCYNGDIVHRIDLEADAVPFQQRPYRLPMALRDEVQRQIEDMLRQRIIQPSTSPFCSPIVMVRKADKKSWRFAVDYRKLNANTQKQTYYLPLIQDILDAVGGKRIYSNFDFQSGFHQIPVYPPHIPRTAFATFMGLFEFVRMPFGLCSAPSTFQRVMKSMRKELMASFYVYLDD